MSVARCPRWYDHPMLERLEVKGLGIIDEVCLDLRSGFAVLTGETGAGKSLLVESLKLLSGQRAQHDLVRSGEPLLDKSYQFRRISGEEFPA